MTDAASSAMTAEPTPRKKWLFCVVLAMTVPAVFGRSLSCTFTAFDDGDYVTENPVVQRGLTWAGLKWAFTTSHAANWHPLTWISHMADCQIFQLDPVGHHLTSLLLHAANSVLLFLLLHRMTASFGPSAWVAAIFALHPLRVESVAWVAERKDVLSTFFWMLTMGAYLRYVEGFKVQNGKHKLFYALALGFYALGLMAKPMLVTLPCVLLLLDYWPLHRLELGRKFSWRLVWEKGPFLLLALGASAVTFYVQKTSGVVATFASVSMGERLANIPVAYVRYLGKIFWPVDLAIFYGFQKWSLFQILGSIALLAMLTVAVLLQARVRPWLAVGWFWFVGMLVPTIGLIQVGHQSMADRYSYLSSVGISIMVAWTLADWISVHGSWQKFLQTASLAMIAACMILTPHQIGFWRNANIVFTHAADVSEQSCTMCYNIGCLAMQQAQFDRAARCFERAIKAATKDDSPSLLAEVHNNLGCANLALGQVTDAVTNFEMALQKQARYPQAYYNMGRAFMTNAQPDVAEDCFQHALAMDQNPAVLSALASAFAAEGKRPEAVAALQRARTLAISQNKTNLVGALDVQLRSYQSPGEIPRK